MNVDDSVNAFVEEHRLIRPHMRLVAGVSGGADSMALIQYLFGIRERLHLSLAVCSVDHRLRGKESEADLHYVSSWCGERRILFYGRTVDVPAYIRKTGMGVEEAARELRYRAFADVLRRFRADALVLAHHGDDQIETMLMRQVNGRIGPGRAGIPVSRPFAGTFLIRPFLSQSKEDLERYCREHGIEPRTDATNASDRHTRNRFRQHILPFLKCENPAVHLKFQYASERIAEDEQYLMQAAENQLTKVVVEKKKDIVKLSVPHFLNVARSLQRRIIHLILNYLYAMRKLRPEHQSIHIDQMLRLMRSGHPSGSLLLPKGLAVRKSYKVCLVGFFDGQPVVTYNQRINIPGETRFPAGVIKAEFLSANVSGTAVGANAMIVDCRSSALPLRVRTRKPGDRIGLIRTAGSQKVKSVFIDKKIDRRKRSLWPIVVDRNDRVLWLPLLKRGRCPDPENGAGGPKYLLLEFIPTDDFGGTEA